MENPLEQPRPVEAVEQIHALARDLAYGAINRLWSSRFNVAWAGPDMYSWINTEGNPSAIDDYLEKKWANEQPIADLLLSFGYVNFMEKLESGTKSYILTEKAFALLQTPNAPPGVFISYRRSQSSALGLLVVARLKAVGVMNPFIDMVIDPGAEWHALLEKTIRQSRYFIALLAPGTLESEYVRSEIAWALDTPGQVIIPVWHNGFKPDATYPDGLATRNAIRLKEESAEEYELAMIKLLNRLGYGP